MNTATVDFRELVESTYHTDKEYFAKIKAISADKESSVAALVKIKNGIPFDYFTRCKLIISASYSINYEIVAEPLLKS